MKRTLELHQLEKLADRFKILSEASRLRILKAICREERSVSEICDCTKLNQANVSKYLQLLKSAGVVAYRQVGICRYYRIIDLDLLDLCTEGDRQIEPES
ncbi:ArsR/SmtB family transcription factor [Myxosarcina sp. GI1(2024)]